MRKSYLWLLMLTLIFVFACSPANNINQEAAGNQMVAVTPSVNPTVTPSVSPTPREYSKNLDDLRASFNRDKGKVRLVTLLSPT